MQDDQARGAAAVPQFFAYYVEECLVELDALDTPCQQPGNMGSNMVSEVIPRRMDSR